MIWALLTIAIVVGALCRATWRWRQKKALSLSTLAALSLSFLALGAILRLAFHVFDLTLEHNGTVLWGYAITAVALTGLVAARRCQRIPSLELFLSLVVVIVAAVLLAYASSASGGIAAPPFRVLLIAPAALPLAVYFGASLGYLMGQRGAWWPGYETLVARRFLLSKASPVLSTVTTISLIGVAIGVWLVIVSLAVLSGFEFDLKEKIIGVNAPLMIQKSNATPFVLSEADAAVIGSTRGVVATSPLIEGEAAISSSSNYTGGIVFGIDPERAKSVLSVLGQIVEGSASPLAAEMREVVPSDNDEDFAAPTPVPRAIIGVEMAKGLNIGVGDRIRLISPILETMTPLGPAPKSATLEVAAIFSSKMYEYDARYLFLSLPVARRFFELQPQEITGIQATVTDPELADAVGATLTQRLGQRFAAIDWKGRNQTLFAALKLERVVAFVVLVFIILVASFAIVNTLTMSVIEKKKDIAILKTMGAHDRGIMKLFLSQGLIVGLCGTVVGTVAALVTVFLLQRFGFAIPGDVYYIDSLPVHMEPLDVLVVLLAALLIVWDFAVFPALSGSRLSPVEGLRDG